MKGFDEALRIVLRFEGGRVDDQKDRGGRTAYGVTQRTFDTYRGEPGHDVWDITPEEVAAIYRHQYWDAVTCDAYTWPLSLVLFDSAVLSGPKRARIWLSQTRYADTPETNSRAMIALRRKFYRDLAARDRSQEKFVKGWMNRLDALAKEAGV